MTSPATRCSISWRGSIEIKADVVRRDEREAGVRKTLNFGHTIGHAVELCSGYACCTAKRWRSEWSTRAALAERLGIAEPGTAARIREAIVGAGLDATRFRRRSRRTTVVDATRGDKKARAGQVEYALPATDRRDEPGATAAGRFR